MENKSANSGQGNFFNGFLLGLLVGAFVVFVLGTKKGKKLLKAISEKGLDDISNILDGVDKEEDLDEVYEEEQKIAPKRKFLVKEKSIEEKAKPKRFFRGISRHLN